jgi:hypothetical protein
MKKKRFPLVVKILIICVTVVLTLYAANDFLMPIISGRVFGSSADLSDIKIGNFRPFLPVAKLFCEIKGRSYQQLDFEETLNGNSWVCVPGFLPFRCEDGVCAAKPVIYLYPKKPISVKVTVDNPPGFSTTYPEYNNGWEVIAYPDGKIIDKNKQEYSYLYWEGNPDTSLTYNLSTGFVVKGEDVATFLQQKLTYLGLTPKEYNEFIVYWLPKMVHNGYNLIHFASQEEYANRIKMNISPKPDSILRVFMVFKPLNNKIDIEPQILKPFNRTGFAVVEWGGSEL